MTTRKAPVQRKRKTQTPTRRKRVAPQSLDAAFMIDTLRKMADGRMSMADFRREGFTLPPKAEKIRSQIRRFIGRIKEAQATKPLRRRA